MMHAHGAEQLAAHVTMMSSFLIATFTLANSLKEDHNAIIAHDVH